METESLDLTADNAVTPVCSSPTGRSLSCGGDSDHTLIDDGSRELRLSQCESPSHSTLNSEDTIMADVIQEDSVMVKREPFSNVDIPIRTLSLSKLQEPTLCEEHPTRRDEILQLFLRRTTFSAEVWTNYTPTEWTAYKDSQEFFHDEPRVLDCGKLQLRTKGALDQIKLLDPREFEMMKVKFVIGTPFRPLFCLLLVVSDGHLMVMDKSETDSSHTELREFIKACRDEILSTGLVYGKKGMTVQDLEHYASLFVNQERRRSTWSVFSNTPSYFEDGFDQQNYSWYW